MDDITLSHPSVIDDLWYGRLDPHGLKEYQSEEYLRLLRETYQPRAEFEKSLTEEQKNALMELDDLSGNLSGIAEAAIFRYAFKLGARMMLEMLSENT